MAQYIPAGFAEKVWQCDRCASCGSQTHFTVTHQISFLPSPASTPQSTTPQTYLRTAAIDLGGEDSDDDRSLRIQMTSVRRADKRSWFDGFRMASSVAGSVTRRPPPVLLACRSRPNNRRLIRLLPLLFAVVVLLALLPPCVHGARALNDVKEAKGQSLLLRFAASWSASSGEWD